MQSSQQKIEDIKNYIMHKTKGEESYAGMEKGTRGETLIIKQKKKKKEGNFCNFFQRLFEFFLELST